MLAVYGALPGSRIVDAAVTQWVQRAAPGPDLAAAIFVFLGNAEVVIPATALTAALLFARGQPGWTGAAWLTVGLAVGSVLAVAFKLVLVHPGPHGSFLRPGLGIGLQAYTPFSFPSGHTIRTTMIAGAALRHVPWLGATLVLAMMTALVYVGAHWLSDVLGGLCLGWALLGVCDAVTTARSRSCPPD
jgi:membrane-associated phospholipid phosphatase